MKAITLDQPYAQLIFNHGPKRHETRSWRTAHRGWLAIHSSLRQNDRAQELWDQFGAYWDTLFDDLPRGKIVGLVYVNTCIEADRCPASQADRLCGDFSARRWAWDLRHPRALFDPIECRGFQKIWTVPDDVEQRVLSRLILKDWVGPLGL